MSCLGWRSVLRAVLLLAALPLVAQPGISPGGTASTPLSQLVRGAGFIFSGTVLSVARDGAQTGQAPSIRTTFKIDRGILGVRTGSVFTIREWAGVWESGERYRPGQQVFLFLYPRSKLGLTSAVAGSAGRFPVESSGLVQTGPLPSGSVNRSPLPAIRKQPRITQRDFVKQIRRAVEENHGAR